MYIYINKSKEINIILLEEEKGEFFEKFLFEKRLILSIINRRSVLQHISKRFEDVKKIQYFCDYKYTADNIQEFFFVYSV